MKNLLLMFSILLSPLMAKSNLEKWLDEVDAYYSSKEIVVGLASTTKEYESLKKSVKTPVSSIANREVIDRLKEIDAQDRWEGLRRSEYYLGHLFCETMGLKMDRLLANTNCDDGQLVFLVADLFTDYEFKNFWESDYFKGNSKGEIKSK